MSERKIVDAKKDGNKIYFKGHAKATFMSDGKTVEDAINNINIGGGADLTGYATEIYVNEAISSKQDIIDDLDTIRSRAALGATALQSETYKGTITGVSVNGTSVATSGVANIPAASASAYGVTKLSSSTSSTSTTLAATASAVKSAYDLANGKQAKLVSGTNIKTINGESILGLGNLTVTTEANIQAVDTGDIVEDVNVSYATTEYVDGLIGDINTILESIINGGVNSIFPITLTLGDNGLTAVDLFNYVAQNHENGIYSFKENEIVEYNSSIIPYFYYNGSVINYDMGADIYLGINQSGFVSTSGGGGA